MTDAQPTPSAWTVEADQIRGELDKFDAVDYILGAFVRLVGEDPEFVDALNSVAAVLLAQRPALDVRTQFCLSWGTIRMCDDSLVLVPRELR